MKIALVIFTTLCLIVDGYGQITKCKLDVNEFDSFSGSRIVKTKSYSLGKTEKSNYSIDASVRKVDSTYFLYISGIPGECISDHDTEVSFKTVTGEVYTLKHIGEVDCGQSVYVGSGVTAKIPPVIILLVDKPEIRQLGMSMLRIEYGQSYANLNILLPMMVKQLFDCADNAPEVKKKS